METAYSTDSYQYINIIRMRSEDAISPIIFIIY